MPASKRLNNLFIPVELYPIRHCKTAAALIVYSVFKQLLTYVVDCSRLLSDISYLVYENKCAMKFTNNVQKLCINCGKPVKGRSDKKFCDDYCRNNYNNAQKAGEENLIRNIHNALRKNRKILIAFLQNEDNKKVHREKLHAEGFNFKYHTHQYLTQKGHSYIFCYDYGYLMLDRDWYLIVREKATY